MLQQDRRNPATLPRVAHAERELTHIGLSRGGNATRVSDNHFVAVLIVNGGDQCKMEWIVRGGQPIELAGSKIVTQAKEAAIAGIGAQRHEVPLQPLPVVGPDRANRY